MSVSSVRSVLLPLLVAAVAVAVLASVGSAGRGSSAIARAAATKPNVVMIMTDDQTVDDLRLMAKTKQLLGGQGVSFQNSFVSYSLCCPSRATYFSGQYAHNHHVLGLEPPTGGYGRFDRKNSLSVWMQQAGYYTTHIGKMMNGYGSQVPADVPPGFNEWHGSKDPTTYRMWGYTLNDNGTLHTYGDRLAPNQDPKLYQTDFYTGLATDFIRRRSNQTQPFFLSLAYLAPHHETEAEVRKASGRTVRAAPRDVGKFANAPLPHPKGFNEQDLSDKPAYVRRRTPPMTPENIAAITANYRARQESLQAVDDGVQQIVDSLKRSGVYDNTYIMFTSDNGFLQGEHRVRSGKMLPYEPSIKVPLLIEGPGIPQGRTSKELVGNIDLAPTILDIASGRAGKIEDGRSLLPYAQDPKKRSERVLLNETGGQKPGKIEPDAGPVAPLTNILTYTAVRTPRYMYVNYKDGSRELYDLRIDPAELHSRHDDPRYRDTRTALRRELRRLATCKGSVCRKKSRPIPPPAPKVIAGLGIDSSPVAAAKHRRQR